jgi:predicted transcriptional regulator
MAIREYFDEMDQIDFDLEQLFESGTVLMGGVEKPMTGAQIARELGITRQAVSNNLKRAMTKVYAEVKKMESSWGPFEVAVAMSQMFGVEQDSPEELKKFFKLFPPKIRKEIEQDAVKQLSPADKKKIK